MKNCWNLIIFLVNQLINNVRLQIEITYIHRVFIEVIVFRKVIFDKFKFLFPYCPKINQLTPSIHYNYKIEEKNLLRFLKERIRRFLNK